MVYAHIKYIDIGILTSIFNKVYNNFNNLQGNFMIENGLEVYFDDKYNELPLAWLGLPSGKTI